MTGEEAIQPSSDSFWEIGKYKRTVKRAEDGFRLSEDLIAMVQERIAIEKKYAKSLKLWSQKWAQHVEKVCQHLFSSPAPAPRLWFSVPPLGNIFFLVFSPTYI